MKIIAVLPQLHVFRLPEINDLAVHVWNDGSDITLVDCGVPGTGSQIAHGLAELGYTTSAVRRLVLTHGHPDHIGAAAEIKDWGAQILVHRDDADAVRGTPLPPPNLREWELPIVAALPQLPLPAPAEVDHELDNDDTIDFGGGATVMALPGHTRGSIAIHLPRHRVLFAGDTLANVDGDTRPGVFNHDSEAVEQAVATLAEIDVDVICVGHGDVLTGNALTQWRASALSGC